MWGVGISIRLFDGLGARGGNQESGWRVGGKVGRLGVFSELDSPAPPDLGSLPKYGIMIL